MKYIGQETVITDKAELLAQASALILPGVGAFADAAERLQQSGLAEEICRQSEKKPLLGICLGMQLLFSGSQEGRAVPGLGLLEGTAQRIQTKEKLPQIGWNALEFQTPCPLFYGLEPQSYVYFVHSFHCLPQDASQITATTDYGSRVTAAVQKGNCFGCQFHPEKSGDIGLQILRNFGALL